MKLCYIDLETTGTKFWRNGIHQISGCIEIDGEVKESFDFKVKPFHSCDIEDEALAVGGKKYIKGFANYSASMLTNLKRQINFF